MKSDRALGPADEERLKAIVDTSARRYITTRHQKVAPFCAEHFSPRGAWCIHRKALGHDLWKAPVNVLWAPPYLLSRGIASLCRKLGRRSGADWLYALRPGFETAVAREVEWLIYTELLELPLAQPARSTARDVLLETMLSHPGVTDLLLPELRQLDWLTGRRGMREKLEEFLSTYTVSRTAASELAGSLLNLAAGAAAFHQLTPGAVGMGSAAAAALAQHAAIANFAFGPSLGSLYYAMFPATASAGLIASSVGGAMAVMGILSAFAGMVTDPIQQALGLHERRLHRLLAALEAQLTGADADFRLRDAYVARLFDLVDAVRAAVSVLRG